MDEIEGLLSQGAKRVEADPNLRKELLGWNRRVVIRVPHHGEYTITVTDNAVNVAKGPLEDWNVIITVDRETLFSVAEKKTSLAMAYLNGKIKVKGEASVADFRRLQKLI